MQAEGRSYWNRKVYGTPRGTEADDTAGRDDVSNSCIDRALSQEEHLFLTITRLRPGVPLHHMANLFSISVPTSWRVFASWINLLFFALGSLNYWLPKEKLQETMPDSFKKFPSTRVILDATEFKVQSPSSLLRQSQVFSQCEYHYSQSTGWHCTLW